MKRNEKLRVLGDCLHDAEEDYGWTLPKDINGDESLPLIPICEVYR